MADGTKEDYFQELFGSSDEDSLGSSHHLEEQEPDIVNCNVCEKLGSITGEESKDDIYDMMWSTGSDTTGLVITEDSVTSPREDTPTEVKKSDDNINLSKSRPITEKNFRPLHIRYFLPDGSFMRVFGRSIKKCDILYNFTFPNGFKRIPRLLVYVTHQDFQRHPGLWQALLNNYKVRKFPDGTCIFGKEYFSFPPQTPESTKYCGSLATQACHAGEEVKGDFFDMMWRSNSDTGGVALPQSTNLETIGRANVSSLTLNINESREIPIEVDDSDLVTSAVITEERQKLKLRHFRYFLPDGSFMRVYGKGIKDNDILFNYTFPNGFERVPGMLKNVTQEDIQKHPGLWEAILDNQKVRKFPNGTATYSKDFVPFPSQIAESSKSTKSNSVKNEALLIKESEPENNKSSKTNIIIEPVEKIKIFLPDGSYKRVPVQDIINNEELKTFTNYTPENPVSNYVARFEDIKRFKALQELFSDFFLHSKLNSVLVEEGKDSVGTDCSEHNLSEKTAVDYSENKESEKEFDSFNVNEHNLLSNSTSNFINENSELHPFDNIIPTKKENTFISPSQDNLNSLSSFLNIPQEEKEYWRSRIASNISKYRVWFEDRSFIRIKGSTAYRYPELLKAVLTRHKVTIKDLECANHLDEMLQSKLSKLKSNLVYSRNVGISKDSQIPVLYSQDEKNTARTKYFDETSTQDKNDDCPKVLEHIGDTSLGNEPLKPLDQKDCEDEINPQGGLPLKSPDKKDCGNKINPHKNSLLKNPEQKDCEEKINPQGDSSLKSPDQKDCVDKINPQGDSSLKSPDQKDCGDKINPQGDSSLKSPDQKDCGDKINPQGDSSLKSPDQKDCGDEINHYETNYKDCIRQSITSKVDEGVVKGSSNLKRYRAKRIRLTLPDGTKLRLFVRLLEGNKYFKRYQERVKNRNLAGLNDSVLPPEVYSDSSSDECERWVPKVKIPPVSEWEDFLISIGSSKTNPLSTKWRHFVDKSSTDSGSTEQSLSDKWSSFMASKESHNTQQRTSSEIGPNVSLISEPEPSKMVTSHFQHIANSYSMLGFSSDSAVPNIIDDNLVRHLLEPGADSSTMSLDNHINASGLTTHSTEFASDLLTSHINSTLMTVNSSTESPEVPDPIGETEVISEFVKVKRRKSVDNADTVTLLLPDGGKIKLEKSIVQQAIAARDNKAVK